MFWESRTPKCLNATALVVLQWPSVQPPTVLYTDFFSWSFPNPDSSFSPRGPSASFPLQGLSFVRLCQFSGLASFYCFQTGAVRGLRTDLWTTKYWNSNWVVGLALVSVTLVTVLVPRSLLYRGCAYPMKEGLKDVKQTQRTPPTWLWLRASWWFKLNFLLL